MIHKATIRINLAQWDLLMVETSAPELRYDEGGVNVREVARHTVYNWLFFTLHVVTR